MLKKINNANIMMVSTKDIFKKKANDLDLYKTKSVGTPGVSKVFKPLSNRKNTIPEKNAGKDATKLKM